MSATAAKRSSSAIVPADFDFPSKFAEYRRGQLDVAAEIAASTKRFSLLSAPTGSGKA